MISKNHDTLFIKFDESSVYNQRMFKRTGTEFELSDTERVILYLVSRIEDLEDDIERYEEQLAGEDY